MNYQQNNGMQSTQVTTGRVRFSYAEVFQAKSFNGGEAKYSTAILIPKSDTQTLNAINNAIQAAIQAGAAKLANSNGQIPPNLKTPLRDGDIERPDQPEYAGHYFLNASSKRQPEVVDANVQPIINQADFYSGCYGRALLNFYAFAGTGNKGIAVGLNAVQKLSDGEPLSGGMSAAEAFGQPMQGQAPQQQQWGQQPQQAPQQQSWGNQPQQAPQQPPQQQQWGATPSTSTTATAMGATATTKQSIQQ